MKVVTGFVILAVFVLHVSCENCTVNTDCRVTSCANGTHVICEHPDTSDGIVANGGLCTCAQDGYECITKPECHLPNAAHLLCPDASRHCYDNKCICTRWPPASIVF